VDITVLCGGEGLERDVSRASGHEVARALVASGHSVLLIDPAAVSPTLYDNAVDRGPVPSAPVAALPPTHPLGTDAEQRMFSRLTSGETFARMAHSDAVFLAFHGGAGEDGHVQALFEMAGLPFSGAGSATCSLAWNKAVTSTLLADVGVAVPVQRVVRPGQASASGAASLLRGGPIVVKPLTGGSSVAVSVVRTTGALNEALAVNEPLVVEEFLPGREYAVGVVDRVALPIVEIEPAGGSDVFDYVSKYQPGGARETCPADVDPVVAQEMVSAALRAHELLGFGAAHSRSDFRCDASGRPRFLEINALPGLTPTSLLPFAAAAQDWSYSELITRVLASAF